LPLEAEPRILPLWTFLYFVRDGKSLGIRQLV